MESWLERIGAVHGVKGVFLLERNRVVARRFPAVFPTETLARTAPVLAQVFEVAGKTAFDARRLVLTFPGSLLLVDRIGEAHLLVVWMDQEVHPEADQTAVFAVIDASRAAMEDALRDSEGMGGGEAVDAALESDLPAGRAAAMETHAGTKSARPDWTEADRAVLCDALARYVGPVASLIVGAAMRRAPSRQALVQMVAREIEPAQDREAFLRELAGFCSTAAPTDANDEADA